MKKLASGILALWLGILFLASQSVILATDVQLLNVSYDPTRELYTEYNARFAEHYLNKAGVTVKILQSHGGSGKQARSVIDGLRADVVTLALAYDVQAIADRKLIGADWETRLPSDASPYTSTIVFLVRQGNPKNIRDWSDLVRPGIQVITPNPKTSGGARWNFLAAWGYVTLGKQGGEAEATAFVKELFKHVPVLDSGARGATTTFVQKELGDVYLAWENEALLATREYAAQKLQLVYPSISILAQPSVALVDRNVDSRGPEFRAAATEYLQHLYTAEIQELIARNGYRPIDKAVLARHRQQYPEIKLFTIKEVATNWPAAQRRFFSEDGIFDRISHP
jgi:sulfate/thiosulfate transport system substrate-binding protein